VLRLIGHRGQVMLVRSSSPAEQGAPRVVGSRFVIDQAQGKARIGAAAALVPLALSAPKDAEGIIDLSALATGADIVPGATDALLRRELLKALGVLVVGRGGRGGRPYVAANAAALAARIVAAAEHLWARLGTSGAKLTRAEVAAHMHAGPFTTEESVGGERLLKLLQLAAGVTGQSGGLQAYAALAADAEAAQKSLAQVETQAVENTQAETSHESVYYEPVADALRGWDGWTVAVLGVKQLGVGEWSTPDIMAYSVSPAPATIIPILRVATVEVKHVLTRQGIAEAAAHRRFAHYSYVAAPVAPVEIDPVLITACVEQGVGLICPRQRSSLSFHVHFDPPLHHPDDEDLNFALAQFRTDDGVPISRDVFEKVRSAFAIIFGAPPG